MKWKLFISLFIVLISSFGLLQAQKENRPQFVAGKLYVKIKPSTHLVLPKIGQANESEKLAADFPELLSLMKTYQIHSIQKSFPLEDPIVRDIYTFRFDFFAGTEELLKKLSAIEYIEYAEQCPMFYPTYTPNDYNATAQWHLQKIQATTAWNYSKGDRSIGIAIVDDAVLTTHPDLAANIWTNPNEIAGNSIDDDGNGYIDDVNGWDAADNDANANPNSALFNCQSATFDFCHGTGVASCASAVTDNGTGIAAIGFHCGLIPVKSRSDANTTGGIDAGYEGVAYAAKIKAPVINMSWGGAGGGATGQAIITAAHNAGCVLVAAAGNDNVSTNFYPACYQYIISVAATNDTDTKTWFSCFNDSVDVSSPGEHIRTANVFNGYDYTDGTSEASPIVAGLCALMISANPCLSTDDVETYLEATCDIYSSMSVPTYVNKLGAGRINAGAAMAAIYPNLAASANFTAVVNNCGGTVQYNYAPSTPLACGTSYNWSFPGGTPSTSTLANPVVTYSASGNYTASLVALNAAGGNQATQNVTINFQPTPQVSAGTNISGCYNTTGQLIGTCSDPNATISWYPTSNLSSGSVLTPNVQFLTSRDYILTATSAAGCVSHDTVSVQVHPNPSTYAGADVTIAMGGAAQLNAIGAQTYSWDPPIGLSAINIANPVANPTCTRIYSVFGSNQFGCVKLDGVLVTVTGCTTAMEEAFSEIGQLSPLQPNPANNNVTFAANFVHATNLNLSLLDISGKKVNEIFNGKVNEGEFSYNWKRNSNIAAGMYWVVWEVEGKKMTQKLSLEQ